jgi:hypothetical protein
VPYNPLNPNTNAPAGFYGFRSGFQRQFPVWMNSGAQADRPVYDTTQNLPPAAARPAAPVMASAPAAPVDMGQGFMQPEGGGGGYGAPDQPNITFGDFMNALGFGGFGSANNTTSGTAPLGAVSSEPLGALDGGMGGMGSAGPETNAVGGDIGGGPQGDFGGQMGDFAGMYRGGIVTPNRLQGHNPPGPDDGYVAMDKGEGVLTAKAIQHYGPGIVARLNKLAVPKGAFAKR